VADLDQSLADGDQVAKWTFISTIVLAVLFVGSVFVFILW
jgi:hypothetical protein